MPVNGQAMAQSNKIGLGRVTISSRSPSCARRTAQGHQLKRLGDYGFVEALPKNKLGKLLKTGLRPLLADTEPG